MALFYIAHIPPQHYDAFRGILHDHIPDTYDKWSQFHMNKAANLLGRGHTYKEVQIEPDEFGMERGTLPDIAGGDAAENAAIIRAVLSGEKSSRRDVVLLNSAAALVAAGKAEHIAQAVPLAAKSIDLGAAAAKLNALARFISNR